MIPDELRALTVKQPHASAIVLGHKDIENRSWRFPLPLGTTIAIHAGMSDDPAGLRVPGIELPDILPRGHIIGLVDVVGCLQDASVSPWSSPGHWHWILANPRPLREPIACRGALKLFRPPADVIAAIRAA